MTNDLAVRLGRAARREARPLVRSAARWRIPNAMSGWCTPITGASAPRAGPRSKEWTAIGQTELEVVIEMARCLSVIREGAWPT